MVNVTTSDILTEERIRRVVEEEQEERLLWNQAFRTLPLPDDWPTDTMEIPEDQGIMGEPERVGEGSAFPREEEDYQKTPITAEKYGFEVAFSMESQLYSVFNIVQQNLEKASRKMAELINRKAFNELDANLHANSPVSSGTGAISYGAVVDAKKEVQDSLFNPDMLIVNTDGEADLLKSDEFQRASDLGDEVTQEGVIGRVAGLDVMVDNSDLMTSGTSEGYLVDSDEYGYELVKRDVAIEEYEAPERQSDVVQLYTLRNWKAIDSDAAIKVTG